MAAEACAGCLGAGGCWICNGDGCDRCDRTGRCHVCHPRHVVQLEAPCAPAQAACPGPDADAEQIRQGIPAR